MTADVVAIAPVYGVYQESSLSYKTVYTSVVCKCGTIEGDTVWAYMTVDEYKANFDEDASITSANFAFSDMVVLEEPVRVSGLATAADSVVSGLAESIGEETVMTFGEAEVLAGAEVREESYDDTTEAMACAYAEITSIVPAYTLNNGTSLLNTSVVCSCDTADGEVIYVVMSVEAYNTDVDETALLSYPATLSYEQVRFAQTVTVHGVAIAAGDVASGLAEAIGMDTVLFYVSAE